jgi:hypothetical protein
MRRTGPAGRRARLSTREQNGVLVRTRIAAVLVGLLATLAPASALPAQAASAVQITYVHYDSPGRDDGSNGSLNAEYVRIANTGTRAVSLKNWTLRDTSGHIYLFGTYTLRAGSTVTVRTGTGTDTSTYRYQRRNAYVWNNDRDTALLRSAGNVLVDSCRWTRPGTGKISC